MIVRLSLLGIYMLGVFGKGVEEVNSSQHQKIINAVKEEVIHKADKYLDDKPITVASSFCGRSAGGKNDFYSEGDYWWPDPKNPEGPISGKMD